MFTIEKKDFHFTFLLLSQHNKMLAIFKHLQINSGYFTVKSDLQSEEEGLEDDLSAKWAEAQENH